MMMETLVLRQKNNNNIPGGYFLETLYAFFYLSCVGRVDKCTVIEQKECTPFLTL